MQFFPNNCKANFWFVSRMFSGFRQGSFVENRVVLNVVSLQVEQQVNAAIEEAAKEADVEGVEGETVEDEESEHLPFPNARVVNIIRGNLKKEHQLKRDVKVAANELLGTILADISQSMDAEDYFTLSIEHFNKAARKYREIALNQKRIRKIQKVLEKQRAELDEIVTEIELETPPENSATISVVGGNSPRQ